MSVRVQQMSIYMPSIFWHDRQGILSIDVLQQPCEPSENNVPMYKIATASMQKEVRVWNFRFEPAQALKSKEKQQLLEPKAAPLPVLTPKLMREEEEGRTEKEKGRPEDDVDEEEESIVCLEEEKENDGDVEMKDLELVEMAQKLEVGGEVAQADNRQPVPQQYSLSVEFLANLEGHRITTNVVRFSPNGKYLASGDAEGSLLVWTLSTAEPNVQKPEEEEEARMEMDEEKKGGEERRKRGDPEMDIPPNKENWVRTFRTSMAHHDSDITALCFSPDSQLVASVSMGDSVAVNRADTGKRLWIRRNFRHFPNGVVWDPRGKYIITLSTDRRMDVLETQKGTLLRCCHQVELPLTRLPTSGVEIGQQAYKLFHDDQLCAFQRGVDFSPCGGVVFAPAAHLEVGAQNIYGTFAFRRADLNFCRPTALFPAVSPTIQVKCSPVLYQLEAGPNFLGLPHRLIFAVLCRDSVLLYNSQCDSPFAYLENLHYDKLTSTSWTPDGHVLVVSSLEGFNSFLSMDPTKLGTPCPVQPDFLAIQQAAEAAQPPKTPVKEANGDGDRLATPPADAGNGTPIAAPPPPPYVSLQDSPKLITPRRPRARKALLDNGGAVAGSEATPSGADDAALVATPKHDAQQPPTGSSSADDGGTTPSLASASVAVEQSPKVPPPKKKPRKVAVMQVLMDDDEGGGGNAEK